VINREHGVVTFPEDESVHRIKKVLQADEMYTRKADDTPTEDRVKDNVQEEAQQAGLRQVPAAEPARPATCTHSVGSIQITGRVLHKLNNELYRIALHWLASISYRETRTDLDQSQREK
jgi:hypothetical protein